MTSNPAEPDAERRAVAQIAALAVDLGKRGFLAATFREGGKLILQVIRRDMPGCRENITIAADENGAWWFWWSWGDPIALVGDVVTASFKVAYVLTPQAGAAG